MIEHRRHLDALRFRLEEVSYRGYATIRRFELYVWYGRERLTSSVFLHLIEIYHEVAGAKRKLSVLKEEGGFLLIDPTRLQSAEKAFGVEES